MATAGHIRHSMANHSCKMPVPVAPTNEQRRIVAKIEELFSDLDAGVAALERAKAKLKRYRAAVLKAAVEGKLTEEWRAKHPPKETASQLLERILKERRRKWEEDQLAAYAKAGKKPPANWKDKYKEPAAPDDDQPPGVAGWVVLGDLRQVGLRLTRIAHATGLKLGDLTRMRGAVSSIVQIGDMVSCSITQSRLQPNATVRTADLERLCLHGTTSCMTIVGTILPELRQHRWPRRACSDSARWLRACVSTLSIAHYVELAPARRNRIDARHIATRSDVAQANIEP